jgi:hypothetical protein
VAKLLLLLHLPLHLLPLHLLLTPLLRLLLLLHLLLHLHLLRSNSCTSLIKKPTQVGFFVP